MVVDLLAGSYICTWNKLIKGKTISPQTFFFKNSILILKLNSKAANQQTKKTPELEYLYSKFADLQFFK